MNGLGPFLSPLRPVQMALKLSNPIKGHGDPGSYESSILLAILCAWWPIPMVANHAAGMWRTRSVIMWSVSPGL